MALYTPLVHLLLLPKIRCWGKDALRPKWANHLKPNNLVGALFIYFLSVYCLALQRAVLAAHSAHTACTQLWCRHAPLNSPCHRPAAVPATSLVWTNLFMLSITNSYLKIVVLTEGLEVSLQLTGCYHNTRWLSTALAMTYWRQGRQ